MPRTIMVALAALLLAGCTNTLAVEQAERAAETNRRASIAATTTEGRRIAVANYRAWTVQRYTLTGEEPPKEVRAWLER